MTRIGGVMVSVHVSSVVDNEFKHRWDQIKDYNKIGVCFFTGKHTALRRKIKQRLVGMESK